MTLGQDSFVPKYPGETLVPKVRTLADLIHSNAKVVDFRKNRQQRHSFSDWLHSARRAECAWIKRSSGGQEIEQLAHLMTDRSRSTS